MIGKTYLERGNPVVVQMRWAGKGPRNVLIRRADGALVVRPFRGLRVPREPERCVCVCSCLCFCSANRPDLGCQTLCLPGRADDS